MALPDASRLRPWRVGGLLVAATLLSAGACNGSASEEAVERNDDLAAELAAELAATDRYTSVEAVYNDDFDNRRTLAIEIRCEGCDPARAVDAALRAAWTSRVTPLRTISVSATDTTGPDKESRDVFVDQETDVAEMQRRYGDRPVVSSPGPG